METMLLIGDKNFSMKDILAVKHNGCIHTSLADYPEEYQVFFQSGKRHRQLLMYEVYRDAEIEFSDERLAEIPYKDASIIAISFYNEALLTRVLMQDDYLRGKGVYVCTVYDDILTLEEFVEKGCNQKMNWYPGKKYPTGLPIWTGEHIKKKEEL